MTKKLSSIETGYTESNRKTQCFYITLATIIGLYFTSLWTGKDVIPIIENVVQLSSIFIAGLAAADSVRYYRFGSNTLGNPEIKKKEINKELAERYADR